MKKTVLFIFLCTSMIAFGQTVLSVPNSDFESGVDATTWTAANGAPIAAEFMNDWQVVSSGLYEGEISIQSATVNLGSGALRIVTTVPAGSTNAKLRSTVLTYTPANPIAGITIDVKFNATSGTSGSARPKVNILYNIDEGAFSEKVLAGRVNPVGDFALHESATSTILAPIVITDPITTSMTIQFEIEFGQATSDIFLDDVQLIVTEGTTLSDEDFTKNTFHMYPNPVKETLNFLNTEMKNIAVFNLLGQKVIERTVTTSLNVSSLPKGIYLIQLKKQDDAAIISHKFVKN